MKQNKLQELFDATFKNKGGIFNIEDLLEENIKAIFNYHKKRAINYIESCRQLERSKPMPDIYFDFIDDTKLNAAAAVTQEGIYLIGVNAGTVIILYDLFFRMLSNPNLLKNIGDVTLEKKVDPTIRNYYSDADLLTSYGDFDYKDVRLTIPNDRIRQAYARHLVDIAIDFLIAHELTHIANGHIDFIKEKFKIQIYEERIFKFKDESDILTIQTLEMDADCLAVIKGLASAVKRHLGERDVSVEKREFYANFNNTIFNWAFSVLTVIKIFVEEHTFRNMNSKPCTHPHPWVRQAMILITIRKYLEIYYPKQYRSSEVEVEILKTVNIAYEYITGKTSNNEKSPNAKMGQEYVSRVREHWKTIRENLLIHSYDNLLQ